VVWMLKREREALRNKNRKLREHSNAIIYCVNAKSDRETAAANGTRHSQSYN
jgi:hypothetical protein